MSIDVSVTRVPNTMLKDRMNEILKSDQIGNRTKNILKRLNRNLAKPPTKAVIEDDQFIAVDIAMAHAGLDAMIASIAVIDDLGPLTTKTKKEKAREQAVRFRIGLRQIASGMAAVVTSLRGKISNAALRAIEKDVKAINVFATALDGDMAEKKKKKKKKKKEKS